MPTPLSPQAVAELRVRYPILPDDYFNYLLTIGWGETNAGRMIYEGPTEPDEVFGMRDSLAGIILLGDDFQGYCFGYNRHSQCYGEVSDGGSWEPWPETDGFDRYVRDPDENDT